MKPHKSAVVGTSVLIASFGAFLWFAAAADRAMDKSGIGDLNAWQALNGKAGLAFWAAVTIWLVLLVLALRRSGQERTQLLSVCGLALLVAPVAWVITLVA